MRLVRTLVCAAAAALVALPGHAAINASGLGAAYEAAHFSEARSAPSQGFRPIAVI